MVVAEAEIESVGADVELTATVTVLDVATLVPEAIMQYTWVVAVSVAL